MARGNTQLNPRLLRWLDQLRMTDVADYGGKNASLGELLGNLSDKGVQVPGGLATSADAFRDFLTLNNLTARVASRLEGLDVDDVPALAKAGAEIRGWIEAAPLPEALEEGIRAGVAEVLLSVVLRVQVAPCCCAVVMFTMVALARVRIAR